MFMHMHAGNGMYALVHTCVRAIAMAWHVYETGPFWALFFSKIFNFITSFLRIRYFYFFKKILRIRFEIFLLNFFRIRLDFELKSILFFFTSSKFISNDRLVNWM